MTDLRFLAVLGRQPEFGLAELESRLGPEGVVPWGAVGALVAEPLEVETLGSVVKVGRILYHGPAVELQKLPVEVDDLPMRQGKTPFGLSVYGDRTSLRTLVAAGLALKKRLRERGPVRLVSPVGGTSVTAAQLKHNRVLEDGFELVVAVAGGQMVVAQTLSVQDIDWYSARDYDRPARSARVGMLPPKLARTLVNTTASSVVVDPFCGTGVVLQEALLLGRSAAGTDVSPEMVDATQQNLVWLAQHAPSPLPAWRVEEADARTVRLPDTALAVVSEGYLGEHLSVSPAPAKLAALREELGALYRDVLANWARQLDAGTELALCVPAWRVGRDWRYLDIVDSLGRLGYTMKVFKHVRQPLLYARPDQIVGRQVLLLRKL